MDRRLQPATFCCWLIGAHAALGGLARPSLAFWSMGRAAYRKD